MAIRPARLVATCPTTKRSPVSAPKCTCPSACPGRVVFPKRCPIRTVSRGVRRDLPRRCARAHLQHKETSETLRTRTRDQNLSYRPSHTNGNDNARRDNLQRLCVRREQLAGAISAPHADFGYSLDIRHFSRRCLPAHGKRPRSRVWEMVATEMEIGAALSRANANYMRDPTVFTVRDAQCKMRRVTSQTGNKRYILLTNI